MLDNPFNLLDIKCDASRSDIASAVEEMDFVLGSEKCSAAQGILTNPIKRLSAEMDWFPDTGDLMIRTIRSYINEGLIIPLTSLGDISALNALLNNFIVANHTDPVILCSKIEEIDKSCKAKTSDGKTIWIDMTVSQYKKYFDSTAKIGIKGSENANSVKFEKQMQVSGTMQNADEIANGLEAAIGTKQVLVLNAAK